MDWADAYAIQDSLKTIQSARGVEIAGLKMGFTSRAKMAQMGVKEPINGFITRQGRVPQGGSLHRAKFINPRIEAEIAVVTSAELKGPGCHIGDVFRSVAHVFPALEVIDSRYRDFAFDLPSVIADNTSAAGWMIGDDGASPIGRDLKNIGVVMRKNGQVVATASGAAVLGHPLNSVAMLANMLARRGLTIPAGTLILTGGITAAIMVDTGDRVAIDFQGLGTIGINIH
ncbi:MULTISPECIES: fumarylacetoacetate hydrolase family protein [unclassified Sphingomonas]|uniref:fumarylacetoacetate hydrolase family protein n=1 Tax=unclassified Sphingomonas TaxID=196159 RepID=UPI001F4443DF|nr:MULTISPECIES: fumarylacetoacetate hydrolase family protein [unclassified Sphingomonas]